MFIKLESNHLIKIIHEKPNNNFIRTFHFNCDKLLPRVNSGHGLKIENPSMHFNLYNTISLHIISYNIIYAPNDSKIVLASSICCSTHVLTLLVTEHKYWRMNLVVSVLPAPLSPDITHD